MYHHVHMYLHVHIHFWCLSLFIFSSLGSSLDAHVDILQGMGARGPGGMYYEEFDPNEIFNIFFG